MVDTILQFLAWAIPSGGIGAAIAWIANRKVKQAESAKQIHDTYKTMYQDISKEWVDTQEKLEKAQRNMQRQSKTPTRRTPAHATPSTVCRVPSRLSSFALIVLLALSAVSCATKRKATQTWRAQQTEQSESHASSASKDTTQTKSRATVSQTAAQTWEQTWLIVPLDSGGYRIVGKGVKTETKNSSSERQANTTSCSTSTDTVLTKSERHSDSVQKTEERKPSGYFSESALLRAVILVALSSIGYIILVKHQKQE